MKKIIMPDRLTAENGSKAALIGEFKELVTVPCCSCGGSGEDPPGERRGGGMNHTWFKCQCGRMSCPYCGGGLASCTVCGGAEGTLPTDCPGKKLQEATLSAIWKGYIDFWDGRWVLGRLMTHIYVVKSGSGYFSRTIYHKNGNGFEIEMVSDKKDAAKMVFLEAEYVRENLILSGLHTEIISIHGCSK